jgi:acyl-coenzyme A synthetase/AMP-(fatty) acid ligase
MSALGLTRILEAAECHTLVFGTPVPSSPWFQSIDQDHPDLCTLQIPSFQEWFRNDGSDGLPYIYQKTWDEAIDDPVLVLTTSGSTGPPKILVYRNSTLVYFDSQYRLGLSGPPLTINQFKGKRLWSSWSMAHLGGIYTNIVHPIYFHNVVVLGPPTASLSVDLSDQMILYGNISSAKYPPFLLDDISVKPKSLQLMYDKLEMIQYGSAPLNKATAAILTTNLYVQSTYATTEMLFPPYFPLEREEWEYYHFHPFAGFEFRPRQDGLFELFVVRKEEYRDFQPIFTTLPDTSCFATKDLWTPHPSKSGLWRHRGRVDDIIVLSEGSLVETTGIASAIQEHPSVRAAIVGGEGRIAPYLLVELVDGCKGSMDVWEESTQR